MLVQLVDISTRIFDVKVLLSLSTKKIRVSQSIQARKYTQTHTRTTANDNYRCRLAGRDIPRVVFDRCI
jgi:hypothetical protein